jgi:hypothetical protein
MRILIKELFEPPYLSTITFFTHPTSSISYQASIYRIRFKVYPLLVLLSGHNFQTAVPVQALN